MFVGTWFQIFSFPFRGAFHRSLALLSSLSVSEEYLALGDGPPGFTPVFPWQALLGIFSRGTAATFAYGTVTLYGRPFQTFWLVQQFIKPPPAEWWGRGIPRHRACKPHLG